MRLAITLLTTTLFACAGTDGPDARGIVTATSTALPRVSDSFERAKDHVADMGDASSPVMRLRPVTFYYRSDRNPGGRERQYGLIAEEVARVTPDLVARSRDGVVEGVFYEFLTPMLLNELQKQQRTIEAQHRRLARLEVELAALRQHSLLHRRAGLGNARRHDVRASHPLIHLTSGRKP